MTPLNLMNTRRIEPVRLTPAELAFVYEVQDWIGEPLAPQSLPEVLSAFRDGLSAKFAGRKLLRCHRRAVLHS